MSNKNGRGYNLKAKEYLKQLYRLDVRINQKIKEKGELKASLINISSPNLSQERVQGGNLPNNKGFTKKIVKLIELEEEINNEIDRFVLQKHNMINQIQEMGNTRYIEILYKHYVEFKRLEVVAVEMNFTYQYIVELHGYALKEFQKTYENLLNSNV